MRIATVSLPVVVLGIAKMLGAAQQTHEGTASDIPTCEMQLLSGRLGARFRLRKPQKSRLATLRMTVFVCRELQAQDTDVAWRD